LKETSTVISVTVRTVGYVRYFLR